MSALRIRQLHSGLTAFAYELSTPATSYLLPSWPYASAGEGMAVKRSLPHLVRPMLATLIPEPFDRPGWVYEEKYDGDRILAYKEGSRVRLLSRNGKDNTDRF